MKTYRIAVIPGDGIETVLTRGPRTRDIGGGASTQEMGSAISEAI